MKVWLALNQWVPRIPLNRQDDSLTDSTLTFIEDYFALVVLSDFLRFWISSSFKTCCTRLYDLTAQAWWKQNASYVDKFWYLSSEQKTHLFSWIRQQSLYLLVWSDWSSKTSTFTFIVLDIWNSSLVLHASMTKWAVKLSTYGDGWWNNLDGTQPGI